MARLRGLRSWPNYEATLMSSNIREIGEMVIKGLPNFVGLLVAVYLLYQTNLELLERNKVLTDALVVCSRAIR